MMVRSGAAIAIVLVLYAAAGVWSQRLTNKAIGMLPPVSDANLDKVRHVLLALVALLGLGLLGRVFWTGCL
jgi:hypothetical protein